MQGYVLMAPALLMLAGCHVPLQSYRLVDPCTDKQKCPPLKAPNVLEVPPPDPNLKGFQTVDDSPKTAKECVDPKTPICLAFLEVDDMGELWEKGERDTALSLIRRTNDEAASGAANAPIVIVFIHGWKNNAAWGNDNVTGFKGSLQEVYRRNGKRPVRGIYIGWRGDLIPAALPVARQFSLYDREATATRIPGATLSSALTEIALRTHENPDALAIFVGHSFGALLLERTISEMTASQLAAEEIAREEFKKAQQTAQERENANGTPTLADTADVAAKKLGVKRATAARADLVILVNSAASATESKQFLNYLTFNQAKYKPFKDSTKTGDDPLEDRPLIVSVTSTSDLATKLALPIGHAIPDLRFNQKGSFREVSAEAGKAYGLACYEPHAEEGHRTWKLDTKAKGAPDQSSYYLSSAPHMQVLQSHEMLKAINEKQMQVSSTGEVVNIKDPQAIAQCKRELFDPSLKIVSTFQLYDTQQCFAVRERPNRCNGTPYWMMEIDPLVVPDHSTIFTGRFISFVIDSFFRQPDGEPMNRVNPELTMSSQ